MPTTLRLETPNDTLDLASVSRTGVGIEAVAGATGFGLPPVALQLLEGAGDGAQVRGQRVLSKQIDVPLNLVAVDRAGLRALADRLSLALAGPVRLVFTDDSDFSEWYVDCYRSGGGSYTYGTDTTGEYEARTVVTFTAGVPFWTSSQTLTRVIQASGTAGLLVGSLANLNLSPSDAMGEITFGNTGTVAAYPTWEVYGPGTSLDLISPTGETLHWDGTLASGDMLILDATRGTIVDGTGANRYAELAPMPRFWPLPPGDSRAVAAMTGTVPDQSRIVCQLRPRRWLVI